MSVALSPATAAVARMDDRALFVEIDRAATALDAARIFEDSAAEHTEARLLDVALTEAHRRGYILDGINAAVGDTVTTYGDPTTLGTIDALTATTVRVDWGTEQTRGVPGSRYTLYTAMVLRDGVLRRLAQHS